MKLVGEILAAILQVAIWMVIGMALLLILIVTMPVLLLAGALDGIYRIVALVCSWFLDLFIIPQIKERE